MCYNVLHDYKSSRKKTPNKIKQELSQQKSSKIQEELSITNPKQETTVTLKIKTQTSYRRNSLNQLKHDTAETL